MSGHILFQQVSPYSALVCLDFSFHLLSCVVYFSWHHLYLASHVKPSQPLLSEEFCHRVHVCLFPDVYIAHMIESRLSSCPPQHAHFSCVQFPLLLSKLPTFCSIHHGRVKARLVHFLFSPLLACSSRTAPQSFPSTLTRQCLLRCLHLSRLLRWHRTLSPDTRTFFTLFTSFSWM